VANLEAEIAAQLAGARRLVEVCAGVRAGETVVIVSDTDRPESIRQAVARAVLDRDATPVVIVMPPVPSGAEPPAPVSAALAAADVILAPTSGAIYHTNSVLTAVQAGTRFLAMTAYTPEVLQHGGIFADFPALEPRVHRLTELLTAASEAHVTAPGGTDLRVRLDGRAAVPITGMARKPGERTGCPDMESFIAPLENSAEGIVVVDASASIAGVLSESIRIAVRGGRAVAIEGGEAAAKIRAALDAAGHPDAYTLAELAFGLNPEGIIRGVIVEDEGVAGTGHVALGSNVFFGGTSAAPIHLDFVYHKPTLNLDGEVVIHDGELDTTIFGFHPGT
jgi:leucyl aminopeptidase (aminopeptidase T)